MDTESQTPSHATEWRAAARSGGEEVHRVRFDLGPWARFCGNCGKPVGG